MPKNVGNAIANITQCIIYVGTVEPTLFEWMLMPKRMLKIPLRKTFAFPCLNITKLHAKTEHFSKP
jgi:hypothetical protein